ncbi:MAG: multiheme c-type cytochrome, partial [Methylocystis sp.]
MLNFNAAIKNFVATVVRRAATRESCVNALLLILAACLLFHAVKGRAAEASYVGSAACASCHSAQSEAWRSSHHAAALAVATPATVLGDFKNVSIESHGSKGRFLRDGDRFIVETEGRDGKTAPFEVAWTFG